MQLITLVVCLLGLCHARRNCDARIWPVFFGTGDQVATNCLAFEPDG